MKKKRTFWDRDTIRWMADAAECEPYYAELARRIAPKIAAGSHVCDAGCGLGYLSLELAKSAAQVTAVDISAQALAVLENKRAALAIGNIEIRCGDIWQTTPNIPYDAMVFSLFGSGMDALRLAKAQCRGDVFMVLRNYHSHRFSVKEHRIDYAVLDDVCLLLQKLSIPYEKETFDLAFGQPFRSWLDARAFFERYGQDDACEITDAFVKSRVQKTEDKTFPYYMPHWRKVGLLHLRVKDIAQDLTVEENRNERFFADELAQQTEE